jgi:hypothetical protein
MIGHSTRSPVNCSKSRPTAASGDAFVTGRHVPNPSKRVFQTGGNRKIALATVERDELLQS